MSDENENGVDVEKLRKAVDTLVESNQREFTELRAAGLQFDMSGVLIARMEGLIEALFPEGGVERLNLDLVFERRVADIMAQGRVQLAAMEARAEQEAPSAELMDVRPADYDVIDPV